jgi:GDP-D-mannose 3',5'-epimerase
MRSGQKSALVCGAGGFIGGHLVKRLKEEGYWVRGADRKEHDFTPTLADEFMVLDLTKESNCKKALTLSKKDSFDEVYQLAAQMGGMGYISSHECDIVHDSTLININMVHTAAKMKVPRYFFSSSVCVYPDMEPGAEEVTEDEAYAANPDNEYGWEKLYAERLARTYERNFGMKVRVARFQNCYGPEGAWTGGKEKAPAAICRKIAEASNGGTIDVWGDGSAIRSYTYVSDTVDGVYRLMHSDLDVPANIGRPEYVSVDELVQTIAKAAGKEIVINHIDGPVGVKSRNFSNSRMYSIGWESKVSLEEGIGITYKWIEEQVNKTHA